MRFSTLCLLLALGAFPVRGQGYDLHLIFEATGRPANIDFLEDDVIDTIVTLSLDPAGLLLTREDADGLLTGLQTVVPRTGEVTWRMTVEEIDALGFNGGVRVAGLAAGGAIANEFLGLVNLYGDGTRYPVFSGEGKVLVVDPRTNAAHGVIEYQDGDDIILRLSDVTGDGTQEAIIFLPGTGVVQVWDNADVVHAGRAP